MPIMNISWSRQAIGGKDADVLDPPGKPRFGVIFLHGIGQETLAGNETWTNILAQRGLACVCPHGQRSWWLDRVCAEFDPALTAERHILDHVVPFFRERWGIGPRAIGICGISMGGQGALRLAFRHPQLFPAAAGIASAIDFHELYGSGSTLDDMYDSKEQCRQDTALMHIRPEYPPHLFFCIDPDDVDWYRGNDRLHEKLSALGVPHNMDLTTQAGGHSWTYFNRMAEPTLRFVAEGLTQESRRLL
jgi:pimeloyl-ACP methyl ester carboxylesterase